MKFQVHDSSSAPEPAKAMLEASEKAFGFIPNLHGVLAESPTALDSYKSISAALQNCGLSPVEQHVVFLTLSAENGCTYCVAAHSILAQMAKMPEENIAELREQKPLSDAKLNAVRAFTLSVSENKGWVPPEDLEAFQKAGFNQQHILDVIALIAMKTISNYTNHLADTPLDEQFASQEWSAKA